MGRAPAEGEAPGLRGCCPPWSARAFWQMHAGSPRAAVDLDTARRWWTRLMLRDFAAAPGRHSVIDLAVAVRLQFMTDSTSLCVFLRSFYIPGAAEVESLSNDSRPFPSARPFELELGHSPSPAARRRRSVYWAVGTLVNTFVGVQSWLALGSPGRCAGALLGTRAVWSAALWSAVLRYVEDLRAWCRQPSGLHGGLAAEPAWLTHAAGPSPPGGFGLPVGPGYTMQCGSLAANAGPLEVKSERLDLPVRGGILPVGRWVPEAWLEARRQRVDDGTPCPPTCHAASENEWLKLLPRFQAAGMLDFVEAQFARRGPAGEKVWAVFFAVPKDLERDRAICDRRRQNWLEGAMPPPRLPHAAQLGKIVLAPGGHLELSGLDIPNYFHFGGTRRPPTWAGRFG